MDLEEKKQAWREKIGLLRSSGQLAETKAKSKYDTIPPRKLLRNGKVAGKKEEHIAVIHLTLQYNMRFHLCRIVSGNIIVINNKVHVLDPKYTWRYKNNNYYIYREFDRRPVSNCDYAQVRETGWDTDSDVPLLKAVLAAVNKPGVSMKNKTIFIVIGCIVGGIALLYFLLG